MLMLYLHVFCNSLLSLENFSTHFTLTCCKCLLHIKKHLYEVIPVRFVERSSILNVNWKNICKKSTYIFLVPSHAKRFTPPYYLDVDNPLPIRFLDYQKSWKHCNFFFKLGKNAHIIFLQPYKSFVWKYKRTKEHFFFYKYWKIAQKTRRGRPHW